MNNDQIWQAVLGELEIGISRVSFITWFKNTFIHSISDDQIIISVPNDFIKRWLEKKYHKAIKSSIEKITEKKVKEIEYQVNLKKIETAKDESVKNIPINLSKSNNIDDTIKNNKIKKLKLLKNIF